MKKYVIALDAGTTSNRAVVFDKDLNIVGISQKEFTQIYPKPGWVEHNADEIWNTQKEVLLDVLKVHRIGTDELAAIGITNQRETTIMWDRATGIPVYNAIVWQDRRTATYCESLKKKHAESIRKKTGLVIDAYFSATKIRWILDNVAGVRERANRGELAFGTVETWLVWKLTNGKLHITDASNASRTMLYNFLDMKWDKDLLELFDIPDKLLPTVVSSSETYGTSEKGILGLEVPISGMAGDQQCSLFGQLCLEKGMVKNTYGTGSFVMMNTGDTPALNTQNLLATVAWKIGDKVQYAVEGSIFIGGALIQWLRDSLKIVQSSAEIETLAKQVEDNGGVVIVPAFAGLGAPHWDQFARGTMFGITRATLPAHIARAALEAIALQVKDAIDEMACATNTPVKQLNVDGGASVNDLLMQLQADLSNCTVVRPSNTETTALGAALFAGLAEGFWKDLEDIKRRWKVQKSFVPLHDQKHEELLRYWHKAVERTKYWIEN